LKLKIQWLS